MRNEVRLRDCRFVDVCRTAESMPPPHPPFASSMHVRFRLISTTLPSVNRATDAMIEMGLMIYLCMTTAARRNRVPGPHACWKVPQGCADSMMSSSEHSGPALGLVAVGTTHVMAHPLVPPQLSASGRLAERKPGPEEPPLPWVGRQVALHDVGYRVGEDAALGVLGNCPPRTVICSQRREGRRHQRCQIFA